MLRTAEAQAASDSTYARVIRRRIAPFTTLFSALAAFLSERLACDDVGPAVMLHLFEEVLHTPEVAAAAVADLNAYTARDAACRHAVEAFLFYKGFHAVQASRVAATLYARGATGTARFLQSRIAEVFNVDIHPAARLGSGLLLDHAAGTVIGETACVGNDCSLLHGVTLGGNGNERGDRHPKIGNGVLIGAGAVILGNIHVGDGARVAASSVVLQSVEAGVTVAGIPAQPVGRSSTSAGRMDHVFGETS